MEATALITDENRQFSLRPVRLPEPKGNQVLVKTSFSGVSIGTEFALIRNKISWGPYPLCTGYMSTGVVEQTGSDIKGIKVGDRVFVRSSVVSPVLEDGTVVSAVSGTHCSHVISEVGGTPGLGLLPEDCDPETSSMFVMPAVGYISVDTSAPQMGESVVVVGCGLIGLGVIAACVMRGCRVIAVDLEPHQLELARAFGADELINVNEQPMGEAVKRLCPNGADVVYESTGIPAMIQPAIELCRLEGKFIWQGNYGKEPFNFSFLPSHERRLKMFFPCDDGYMPCRMTVLKHMSMGLLPWEKTITHRVDATDAPAAYEKILQGDKSYMGVVVRWP